MDQTHLAGAVLSDHTIAGILPQLMDGGDKTHARSAGYEFRPGKLYPTGEENKGAPLDWTDPTKLQPETAYSMKPGELLLLRTKERVKMPANLCGLWSQLDRNSRQGLLLVNQTVVPPGYEGFLTCTFVNFANRPIVLRPSIPIARLLFLTLDQAAADLARPVPPSEYDQSMSTLALEAPSTFLGIAERAAELKAIVETGAHNLSAKADELVAQSQRNIDASITDARKELSKAADDAKTSFQTDLKGVAKVAGPVALVVVALLALAQTGANWLATTFSPNIDKLATERATALEKKIDDQLALLGDKRTFVYSGTAEAKAMADRIAALEQQLEALRAAGARDTATSSRSGLPGRR
jgi:deoxycytidine triphosphate deaminase